MSTYNVGIYFTSIMISTGSLLALLTAALAVRLTINLLFDFFSQMRTALYEFFKKSQRKEET